MENVLITPRDMFSEYDRSDGLFRHHPGKTSLRGPKSPARAPRRPGNRSHLDRRGADPDKEPPCNKSPAPLMTPSTPPLSVIIPAHNEQDYIAPCLDALLAQQEAQEGALQGAEVLLMANACTDATIARALPYKRRFAAKGWKLRILRVVRPGKMHALRCSDKAASGRVLVYLDADVICAPPLLAQLAQALDTDAPRYGSGKLQVAEARTWITRAYAKTWAALPFMQSPAVGAGLFAVNRAGRARWEDFPAIISDDTFVRLQFTPDERIEVPAAYVWPLVEGFGNLVKVRRRQDAGVEEIDRLYPDLLEREAKAPIDYKALFLRNPVSFLCYSAVKLAVRLRRKDSAWTRGR